MRVLALLFSLLTFAAAFGFAVIMGLYAYYARELPDPDELSRRQVFQTARILARDGEVLQELNDPNGGQRTLVRLTQVPKVLRDATIAAEDATFYQNPGFDPRAILRATWQYAREGSPRSGASTITQQLVKNTLLGPEQTAERKIKEAFLALELTRRYTKDQILEMYLNEVYYGNQAYGVEAAAQAYFGKPAQELSVAEATLIAGLPQLPGYYDLYSRLPAAKERQRYVLNQMVRHGMLSAVEADAAFAAPVQLRPRLANTTPAAPHFVTHVREWLEERFGEDALYRSGMQVTTTLDLEAQRSAERAARDAVSGLKGRDVDNAAVVALRPATGEILAMLGSVAFEDSAIAGQVNVALSPRQPGSTLKPFTYLAAFAKGWNPATVLWDIPTTFTGSYRPNNFDNQFRGPVRVRDALGQSLNVPAVQALEFIGIPNLLDLLHQLGIRDLRDPGQVGLSVTLGGGEVRLLDLTYAYAALANGGRQVGAPVAPENRVAGHAQLQPVAVLRVVDSVGKVLYEYAPPQGIQVADPRLVYQVTSVLADDKAREPTFGRDSALVLPDRPAAVKTGTTDDYRDSWVFGYTPDLVTGVWVGNTDGRPMQDVGGAAGAGRIWNAFMRQALDGTPAQPFAAPAGVVEAEVCALSGLLPTPECQERDGLVRDVFVPDVNLPTKHDDLHVRAEVCVVSGKLVTPLVPPNGRESRVFVRVPEPYRAWADAHGYSPPPTESCDDVYRGERVAQITSPGPGESLTTGATVEIVGSAYIDDFRLYTLEFGEGPDPGEWKPITLERPQGVDQALLGVWTTEGLRPGLYTLRLTVTDSLGNLAEGRSTLTLAAPPTPTPIPTAAPTATRPTERTPATTATPRPAATPAPTPRLPVTAPSPTPTRPAGG